MPAILPALIAITIALIVITRPDPLHDPADEGGDGLGVDHRLSSNSQER